MDPCAALSSLLIGYAAPGNGFLRVPRLKGSAGHIVRLASAPLQASRVSLPGAGEWRSQEAGRRGTAVKQPPGRNGEVEQRALFQ